MKPERKKHLKKQNQPISDDLRLEIVEWLSLGKTIASWCRHKGIARRTVYTWIDADDHLAAQIKKARDTGFEALAEECLEIIDTEPEMTGNRGRDAAYVAWQRARVETRLRLLATWDPGKYHPKFRHQHEGGLTLQITTGVQRAAESAVEDIAQKTTLASPLEQSLPPLIDSEERKMFEIKDADYEVLDHGETEGG